MALFLKHNRVESVCVYYVIIIMSALNQIFHCPFIFSKFKIITLLSINIFLNHHQWRKIYSRLHFSSTTSNGRKWNKKHLYSSCCCCCCWIFWPKKSTKRIKRDHTNTKIQYNQSIFFLSWKRLIESNSQQFLTVRFLIYRTSCFGNKNLCQFEWKLHFRETLHTVL